MAKKKYLMDGVRPDGKAYVRVTAEGGARNGVYVVQVWPGGEAKGDPVKAWEMPKALGLEAAVAQAILQTPGLKQTKDAAPAKSDGVKTMMDQIRGVVHDWGHLPEKEVCEALVEEAEGWTMRLVELESEDLSSETPAQ
jgi:hypothetical protein